MSLPPGNADPVVVGRYLLCDPIGGGGMAKVHLGRVLGAAGFSRVVAIKRLHPATANDPELISMLVDEARLVSRIRHPNVVPTLDVVAAGRELFVVMEYIHGLAVSRVLTLAYTKNERIPPRVAARIALDVLAGLHAAHEAKSERGQPLEMVHRDVSPQNVIVDTEGVARVVDFGVAKAEGKLTMTREGEIKGKLAYMAPEQLRGENVDRRADIYAVGVILWELLTCRRLFDRTVGNLVEALRDVMTLAIEPPSTFVPVSAAVDEVVLKALRPHPADRFATAAEMAAALAAATFAAEPKEVAALVARLGSDFLEQRSELLGRIEQLSAVHEVPGTAARPLPAHSLPPRPPSLGAGVPVIETADPASPPNRPRRYAVPLLLALSLAAVVVVTVAAVARRTPRWAASTVSSSSVTLAPTPPAAPPDASSSRLADTAPSASPDAPSGLPPLPSRATGSRHLRPRPLPTASIAPPLDCNPPYAIDSHGIRIPRRECLAQ